MNYELNKRLGYGYNQQAAKALMKDYLWTRQIRKKRKFSFRFTMIVTEKAKFCYIALTKIFLLTKKSSFLTLDTICWEKLKALQFYFLKICFERFSSLFTTSFFCSRFSSLILFTHLKIFHYFFFPRASTTIS